MRFIELTLLSTKKPIYINVENISAILIDKEASVSGELVCSTELAMKGSHSIYVIEAPKAIIGLIGLIKLSEAQ